MWFIVLCLPTFYSRTGRMEAKGCARPATWKNARRQFYWATRARLAQTLAIAQIGDASPEMSTQQRKELLYSLAQLEDKASNDRAVAEAV